MKKDTKDTSVYIKALQPGTLKGGLFVKAGEVVKLGAEDVFTDTWMEKHEAPAELQAAQSKADLQKEQDAAVRLHEEQDKARRGKFSNPAVARSAESEAAIEKQKKDEADKADKAAKTATPVFIVPPPNK